MRKEFDSHKVGNLLIRLRSIVDCIEEEGDQFLDGQVCNDAILALENIKEEFLSGHGDKNENSN